MKAKPQTMSSKHDYLYGYVWEALQVDPVPVQVVDGVAPVILDVPAEGGETHADIKPRQRHPANVSRHVGQHGGIHHGQVVQVPAALEVFLQGRHHRAS